MPRSRPGPCSRAGDGEPSGWGRRFWSRTLPSHPTAVTPKSPRHPWGEHGPSAAAWLSGLSNNP